MRLCPFCSVVENEMHAILKCHVYEDLRDTLFKNATEVLDQFDSLSDEDKFVFLFSNNELVRLCAKTCLILQRRPFLICKQ